MMAHLEPDDDSDKPRSGRVEFSKIPEVAGKVILGFVATAYAMGFLITNIALAGYGAGTVELIRAEYILAGSSFILLCGTASLYCVQ